MHPLLEKALDLNTSISRLAEKQAWSAIEKAAASRQSLLEEYFALRPLPDSHDVIYSVAQAIKDNDDAIRTTIEKHKKTAIDESLNLKSKAHAIKQYRGNAAH